MTSLSICVGLRCRIYLLSATWVMGRIVYQPKTSCPRLFPLVVWYVERTVKAAAARIPIHGSAPSAYFSCRWYVRTIFPINWCILSTVVFACGLPGDAGLVLLPYLFSIKIFFNLWPRNYPLWSYVISTSHGYQTSHVVSANLRLSSLSCRGIASLQTTWWQGLSL